MVLELGFLGIVVGVLSGFFGIGGGTILVPILLFIGFDIKTAIGISVIQMVFSSLYGSYLNFKKGTLDFQMVLIIGVGGFLGALFSSLVIANVASITLEIVFLLFVLFALIRMYFKPKEDAAPKQPHSVLLFFIGLVLGLFSISIGVGGSILLVPLLVGFLHVSLKNAISAGLFFVVFSSVSGVISLGFGGTLDYESGIVIGLASLLGVALGVWLKHKTNDVIQKRLLMMFYIAVATYLFYRLVVSG
ncbi:MAG: sulfite exporter TauE/SafE family protein [Campylobacterota bacterium]|nr:sulfite exporter TauE/SafE family protein [Campylobacterota bacterium]